MPLRPKNAARNYLEQLEEFDNHEKFRNFWDCPWTLHKSGRNFLKIVLENFGNVKENTGNYEEGFKKFKNFLY